MKKIRLARDLFPSLVGLCLGLLYVIDTPHVSFANTPYLPRTPQELPKKTEQSRMVHVKGAEVAYFNRAPLERDFPYLKGKDDSFVKNWILRHCAWISSEQLKLQGIRNSQIPTYRKQRKTGYRPPAWNRSAMVPVGQTPSGVPIGLIDLKGAGLSSESSIREQVALYRKAVKNPTKLNELRNLDHSDGLMTLGAAIFEVVTSAALQQTFNQYNLEQGTQFEVVESYFVISLPFDILRDGTRKDPAALVGRQASLGRDFILNTNPLLSQQAENSLPFYLDYFGNQQSDYFGAAVDMGGVFPIAPHLQKRFLTDNQISKLKQIPQMGPVERMALFNPQTGLEWMYAHQTALAYKGGDSSSIYRHLDEMVGDTGPVATESPKISLNMSGLSEAICPQDRSHLINISNGIINDELSFEEAMLDLFSNSGKAVRIFAAQNLAQTQPVSSTVLRTIDSKISENNLDSRASYIRLMAHFERDPRIHLAVAQALFDSSFDIRSAAIDTLSEIEPNDAVTLTFIAENLGRMDLLTRHHMKQLLRDIKIIDIMMQQRD